MGSTRIPGSYISEGSLDPRSLYWAAVCLMYGFWAADVASVFWDGLIDDILASIGLLGAIGFLCRAVTRERRDQADVQHRLKVFAEDLQKRSSELITENERLRRADEKKTEALAFASHQLRGPLAVLAGHASLLRDAPVHAAYDRNSVATISDSARHLSHVVEDFLSAAAIERGTLEYDNREFDFSVVVEDAAGALRAPAERKGLSFSVLVDRTGAYRVRGDSRKMLHVVSNLIENAVRHTDAGGVSVRLARRAGCRALLVVSDTGSGIPDGETETIFEKFRKGTGARMRPGASGLGLYLAKEITEAHGGRIWARSRGVGVGSDFFVSVPLAAARSRESRHCDPVPTYT